jgi:hypothetical protein
MFIVGGEERGERREEKRKNLILFCAAALLR